MKKLPGWGVSLGLILFIVLADSVIQSLITPGMIYNWILLALLLGLFWFALFSVAKAAQRKRPTLSRFLCIFAMLQIGAAVIIAILALAGVDFKISVHTLG